MLEMVRHRYKRKHLGKTSCATGFETCARLRMRFLVSPLNRSGRRTVMPLNSNILAFMYLPARACHMPR